MLLAWAWCWMLLAWGLFAQACPARSRSIEFGCILRQASRKRSTTKTTTATIVKQMPSACGSISGSFNSDACIRMHTKHWQSLAQLPKFRKRREPKRACYCSNRSLSLVTGHCYTLSALHMQRFSIRNMHFPWVLQHAWFCGGAKS